MGGGGSQETAHIYTHVNEYKRPVLTRVSSFLFGDTLPEFIKPVTEGMVANATPGIPHKFPTGKIGIQIERGTQKITFFKLLFEERRYDTQYDPAIADELKKTFGEASHMEWRGYTVSLPPPTDRFTMAALMRIEINFHQHGEPGKPRVDGGIYVVPMIFGFYNILFSRHYALGLTALQPLSTTKVDTSVRLRP
jgi:hypothetical protein